MKRNRSGEEERLLLRDMHFLFDKTATTVTLRYSQAPMIFPPFFQIVSNTIFYSDHSKQEKSDKIKSFLSLIKWFHFIIDE